MVVSTLLPPSIAASEQPFPRWQLTIFSEDEFALKQVRSAMRAILVIDAVKAITANVAFEPLVGPGINFCSQRQGAMKSGVEDRDLLVFGEQFLGQFNALQSGGIVKWGDGGNIFDGLLNLRRDNCGLD